MKVLEQGEGWHIKVRCTGSGNGGGGCNSLLQVEEDDIYVTSSTDISGWTDFYYTFRCPVCNVETDIKETDVPSRIREEKLTEKRNKELANKKERK